MLVESWDPLRSQSAGLAVAESAGEVEEGEGGGGVAAGVVLGEVAGHGVHLLAKFSVAHDGGTPLLHHVSELGLLAVEGHPAGGSECGKGLAGSSPTVTRDRSDEPGIVHGDRGERVRCPKGLGVV